MANKKNKKKAKRKRTKPKKELSAIEIAHKQRHLLLLGKVQRTERLTGAEVAELARYEGTDEKALSAPDEIIHTMAKAAGYMGVSVRCFRRYVNERGMPTVTVDGRRCYVKGVLDQWKQNEGQAEDPASRRKVAADAGFKETRTEIAKIELARLRTEYGSIAEMERANVRKVVAIRRALLGLGRKLAPRVAATKDARRVRKMIDDEIKTIINGFAGTE